MEIIPCSWRADRWGGLRRALACCYGVGTASGASKGGGNNGTTVHGIGTGWGIGRGSCGSNGAFVNGDGPIVLGAPFPSPPWCHLLLPLLLQVVVLLLPLLLLLMLLNVLLSFLLILRNLF